MNAATIVIIKQNRYIDTFNRLGATSSEKAIRLEEANIRRSFVFNRMIDRGIFVPCENGKFYINNQMVGSLTRHRRKVGLAALLFTIAMLLYLFLSENAF